jgi:hypothetical protein
VCTKVVNKPGLRARVFYRLWFRLGSEAESLTRSKSGLRDLGWRISISTVKISQPAQKLTLKLLGQNVHVNRVSSRTVRPAST